MNAPAAQSAATGSGAKGTDVATSIRQLVLGEQDVSRADVGVRDRAGHGHRGPPDTGLGAGSPLNTRPALSRTRGLPIPLDDDDDARDSVGQGLISR
jgi:hypothetical protein